MNIGIVGSRDFKDRDLLEFILKKIIHDEKVIIVSGGARGADKLAEEFADKYNIPKIIHKPDWLKYGKRAGYIRNKLIVRDSNIIIAFWDGKSKGTKYTIKLTKEAGKPVIIILYENNNFSWKFYVNNNYQIKYE